MPKTPFELAQEQVKAKTLQAPDVSIGGKAVDYFSYQLAVHKFNLNILAGGMKMRGVKLTDLKKYYGLKGKTAKDVIPQFEKIAAEYKKQFEEVAE